MHLFINKVNSVEVR